MQKKDQVFLYIKDEIEKISSAEEKEILDEAKAIEQEAYNQLRGEAEIDAKHQLDKELAEISSKASIEASAQLEERLKKLVEKREEYVNTIFTEVKNKNAEDCAPVIKCFITNLPSKCALVFKPAMHEYRQGDYDNDCRANIFILQSSVNTWCSVRNIIP